MDKWALRMSLTMPRNSIETFIIMDVIPEGNVINLLVRNINPVKNFGTNNVANAIQMMLSSTELIKIPSNTVIRIGTLVIARCKEENGSVVLARAVVIDNRLSINHGCVTILVMDDSRKSTAQLPLSDLFVYPMNIGLCEVPKYYEILQLADVNPLYNNTWPENCILSLKSLVCYKTLQGEVSQNSGGVTFFRPYVNENPSDLLIMKIIESGYAIFSPSFDHHSQNGEIGSEVLKTKENAISCSTSLSFMHESIKNGTNDKCKISCIDNGPWKFYIKMKSRQHYVITLLAAIESESKRGKFEPVHLRISEGHSVLCKNDGKYCRGLTVSSIVDDQITVFLVDYGNYVQTSIVDVFELPGCLLSIPMLLIPCKLQGLQSVSNEQLSMNFTRLVNDRVLSVIIGKLCNNSCYEVYLTIDKFSVLDVINDQIFTKLSIKSNLEVVIADFLEEQNLIYVHFVQNLHLLKLLHEQVRSSSTNASSLKNVFVGQPCIACVSEDLQWCRATIISFQDSSANIKLVDYGRVMQVFLCNLKEIDASLIVCYPAQAVLCSLAGLDGYFPSTDQIVQWKCGGPVIVTVIEICTALIDGVQTNLPKVKLSMNKKVEVPNTKKFSMLQLVNDEPIIKKEFGNVQQNTCAEINEVPIVADWLKRCKLCHVLSPTKFYINLVENLNTIKIIHDTLQKVLYSASILEYQDLKMSTYICVENSEKATYSRAKILEVFIKEVKIFYIDTGIEDHVQIKNLKNLPEAASLRRFPAQAIVCGLNQPSQQYSSSDTNAFKTLIGKEVYIHFERKEDCKWMVDIIETVDFAKHNNRIFDVSLKEEQSKPDSTVSEVLVGSNASSTRSVPNLVISEYCEKTTSLESKQMNGKLSSSKAEKPKVTKSNLENHVNFQTCNKEAADIDANWRCHKSNDRDNDVNWRYHKSNGNDTSNKDSNYQRSELKNMKENHAQICQADTTDARPELSKYQNPTCRKTDLKMDRSLNPLERSGSPLEVKSSDVVDHEPNIIKDQLVEVTCSEINFEVKTVLTTKDNLDTALLPEAPNVMLGNEVFLGSIDDKAETIWLQLKSRMESLEVMNGLVDQVVVESKPLNRVDIGNLCLCLSEDEDWYRALIVSAIDEKIKVHYIDYGNNEVVSQDKLRQMPCNLRSESQFSYKCKFVPDENIPTYSDLDEAKTYKIVSVNQSSCPCEVRLQEIKTDENSSIQNLDDASKTDCDDKIVEKLKENVVTQDEGPIDSHSYDQINDCNKKIDIPNIIPPFGTELEMTIVYVNPDGTLCVQLTEFGLELDNVMDKLTLIVEPINYNWVEIDGFCCAKFSEDQEWYRGMIQSVNNEDKVANVFYIDFGNTETVSFDNLKPLSEEHCSLPKQAIRCFIYTKKCSTDFCIKTERLQHVDWLMNSNIVGTFDSIEDFYVLKNTKICETNDSLEELIIAEPNLTINKKAETHLESDNSADQNDQDEVLKTSPPSVPNSKIVSDQIKEVLLESNEETITDSPAEIQKTVNTEVNGSSVYFTAEEELKECDKFTQSSAIILLTEDDEVFDDSSIDREIPTVLPVDSNSIGNSSHCEADIECNSSVKENLNDDNPNVDVQQTDISSENQISDNNALDLTRFALQDIIDEASKQLSACKTQFNEVIENSVIKFPNSINNERNDSMIVNLSIPLFSLNSSMENSINLSLSNEKQSEADCQFSLRSASFYSWPCVTEIDIAASLNKNTNANLICSSRDLRYINNGSLIKKSKSLPCCNSSLLSPESYMLKEEVERMCSWKGISTETVGSSKDSCLNVVINVNEDSSSCETLNANQQSERSSLKDVEEHISGGNLHNISVDSSSSDVLAAINSISTDLESYSNDKLPKDDELGILVSTSLFADMNRLVFYARLVNIDENPFGIWLDEESDMKDLINSTLKDYLKIGLENQSNFLNGDLCTSFFCGTLHRARIVSSNDKRACLRFIDIGKKRCVSINNVFSCPEILLTIEPMAKKYLLPIHTDTAGVQRAITLLNRCAYKTICTCIDVTSLVKEQFRTRNENFVLLASEESGSVTSFLIGKYLGTLFHDEFSYPELIEKLSDHINSLQEGNESFNN